MEPKKSLVTKLSEVMGVVERVAKNGRNEFHKYDYATEADIVSSVRNELAARNVMIVPSVESTEFVETITAAGKKERLCTLTALFTICDGDSETTLNFRAVGQGQDAGDKSAYKAMTGAIKYGIMKLFLIPTGDDPEKEEAPKSIPAPVVSGLKAKMQAQAAPVVASAPPPVDPEAAHYAELEAAAMAEKPRAHQAVNFRFGLGVGKTSFEVDEKSLDFYIGAAIRSVEDPAKAKFLVQNRAQLEQLQAEKAWRAS